MTELCRADDKRAIPSKTGVTLRIYREGQRTLESEDSAKTPDRDRLFPAEDSIWGTDHRFTDQRASLNSLTSIELRFRTEHDGWIEE
jgi:hypothetical protein